MNYTSSRNHLISVDSASAILSGLSSDGGLYVPNQLEPFDLGGLILLSYEEIQSVILKRFFFELDIDYKALSLAYHNKFDTPEICPLVKLEDFYVLELYHGPTYAFKDLALTALPYIMQAAYRKLNQSEEMMILTATSGDTGSASLEAFRDIPGFSICVFYPSSGVSQIQQRMMQTAQGKNVHVCAILGNFDDAQNGVKQCLNAQAEFKTKLSSANSINIGRLIAQMAYYFNAYADLVKLKQIKLGDLVSFVVPSGNFGNILAAYLAKQCGLPVHKLICASNQNDVLTQFIKTGTYNRLRPFMKSTSPSMDILVSSNVERLLWFITQHDSAKVKQWMNDLSSMGTYTLDQATKSVLQSDFKAYACSEAEVLETINTRYFNDHYLLDPHSAVAACAAKKYMDEVSAQEKIIVLSTASPYKFPYTIMQALNQICSEDDFINLASLVKLTGDDLPSGLSDLAKSPIIHSTCVTIADMKPHLKGLL
ncbi:MAG: threonine synthase [Erysipelotrichaceae bacterium]